MSTSSPLKAVCALTLLAALAAQPVSAQTTTFDSDTSWSVTDASNNPIGSAQYVVLNSQYPTRQPAGATNYGSTAPTGWTADLSSIPGAYWIWAPGITGATAPASLAQFSFSHQFFLNGTPTAGTISVAVDDFASVSVNGTLVGSTGSISDAHIAFQAQSGLATFNIEPYLTSGQNTILVHAQNGPDSFAGTAVNDPYSVNTAGVVFGGSLTSAPAVPEASTTVSFGLLLTLG
ncbi:MAG: hypothetical protein M3Y13_06435, partial [Armatimonadota bacterium]|nr:hypothetical protein [Armatimonadota bacterium]